MFSQEIFSNPTDEYRGTDFWMLNDALDDDEIREQLHEMKRQGIGSVIARTYIGLRSDYPGPDFKRHMHVIVETAKSLGIKIFLQAGYMPEAVLGLPEDYAIRIITPMDAEGADEHGEVLAEHDGLAYVAVNSKTYLDMLSKDAIKFYLKQSYEDMWKEFEDEFGKTCISVWVDEPSYSSSGLPWSPDLPDYFRRLWNYDIAPKVPLLYLDIDDFETVRYHYWRTVQEMLKTSYFQQVQQWCHAHNLLFSGHLMMEDTMASQLSRACATMPFYKYFDIPGIDVLMGDMNWRYARLNRRYESLDFRDVYYTTPLQCTSAANQAGQKHILAEMYGVTTENLGFRDQKHMFDQYASFGINHRSVHGLFYSLRGRCKRAYPPHVNYYQPYWKDYRMLTDYVARASYFISQGQPVKDVAVIHPLNSAVCELRGPKSPSGFDHSLHERDRRFLDLEVQLVSSHIEFDLLDEDTLSMWGKSIQTECGPRLEVGHMSYAAVVLPELKVISCSTLEKLAEFSEVGGKVIILGDAPYLLDGYPEPVLEQKLAYAHSVEDTDELVSFLSSMPKSYAISSTDDSTALQINHRRDEEYDYFFIYNNDCKEGKRLSLNLPGNRLGRLLPCSGEEPAPLPRRSVAGGTSFSIEIPEGGAVMVMIGETDAEAKPESNEMPEVAQQLTLSNEWNAERLHPNVLCLEFARYRLGNGEFSDIYPILAIHDILTGMDYHGPVTLQYVIRADQEFHGLKLAVESAASYTVTLNGKCIPVNVSGYYWARQFETIELTEPIIVGDNILELSRDDYVPLAKFKSSITSLFENLPGVELEDIYLLGDFAVSSRQKLTRANGLRLSHRFTLTKENGRVTNELTTQGYPFYAGTVALTQCFDLQNDVPRAILKLNGVTACHVRAVLNDIPMGCAAWEPFEIELTGLKAGRNMLRLEITNTLRNLIGPAHRPKGEYGEAWGGGYERPNLSWLGAQDETTHNIIPNWEKNRKYDTNAWVEDYIVVPFGIAEAVIKF